MQTFFDQDGLPYTASTAASVELADKLVLHYLGYRRDIGDQLKALLKLDPLMPMAMCMKGYFGKMMSNTAQSARAQAMLVAIKEQYQVADMSAREWLHVLALQAWCDGDLIRAANYWEEILQDFPLDAVALRLAHFNHFYAGDAARIRDSVGRVLPSWPKKHRYYGYVLGMYAFGLEECTEYRTAEKLGRQAVEINPADAWSVHAVAHVMYMQGRRQGVDWISGLQQHWSTVNNFRFHLHWHQCLFHLETGDYEAIFHTYDEQIASDLDGGFYLDMCNAVSLLWRLELYGQDVGDRWHDLAVIAEQHLQDRELIFISLHYLMAVAAAGQKQSLAAIMHNLELWQADGSSQGQVVEKVGRDIAIALTDARNLDFQNCHARLARVENWFNLIGGSATQRQIFNMILADALSHANRNA